MDRNVKMQALHFNFFSVRVLLASRRPEYFDHRYEGSNQHSSALYFFSGVWDALGGGFKFFQCNVSVDGKLSASPPALTRQTLPR